MDVDTETSTDEEVDEGELEEFEELFYYVKTRVADTFTPVAFDYVCNDDWKREEYLPPDAIDERCFPPEYNPVPKSSTCSGEPYDDNFF